MKAVLVTFILGFAVASQAQVIDTYPYYTGGVTNGWNMVGQSFDALGSVMTDYQFGIDGNPTGAPLTVSVFNWDGENGPTGAALYSTTLTWPGSTGDVILSGINVGMTTGNHYGVVVDLKGSTSLSVHYTGDKTGNPTGHGFWKNDVDPTWTSFPTLDTEFKATFSSVPEPASFAVLGLGALALVRRRKTAKS
jgi:hypothetical protein